MYAVSMINFNIYKNILVRQIIFLEESINVIVLFTFELLCLSTQYSRIFIPVSFWNVPSKELLSATLIKG